mgnify:CR=1 FL=1
MIVITQFVDYTGSGDGDSPIFGSTTENGFEEANPPA